MRRRKLPEPFTFFVDECLGRKTVPEAIRAALEASEQLKMLPPGTKDDEWLPQAGEEGWVVLTADRRLMTTPSELQAIVLSNVGIFMVGQGRGEDQAARLVHALPVIRRAARSIGLPFVSRVMDDGSVNVTYEEGEKLKTPRRIKPKLKDRRR